MSASVQPALFDVDVDRPAPTREVQRVTCQTGNPEYYTPPAIVEAARRVMGGIDLDPATCLTAQEYIRAARYHTVEDSGLLHPWSGRVWLNPPYRMPEIQAFVLRLVEHYRSGEVNQAVLLVDAASDTRWFHVAMGAASAVCWTKGRLRFLRPDAGGGLTDRTAPTRGQAICYFGRDPKRFAREFSQFGRVVVLPTAAVCQWCEGRFTPARSDSKFCSAGCKQAAYRARCSLRLGVTQATEASDGS